MPAPGETAGARGGGEERAGPRKATGGRWPGYATSDLSPTPTHATASKPRDKTRTREPRDKTRTRESFDEGSKKGKLSMFPPGGGRARAPRSAGITPTVLTAGARTPRSLALEEEIKQLQRELDGEP